MVQYISPLVNNSCLGGFMEKLDDKWIINPQRDPNQPPKTCKIDQKVPTTLGLENMHDAFYLIAGGRCFFTRQFPARFPFTIGLGKK